MEFKFTKRFLRAMGAIFLFMAIQKVHGAIINITESLEGNLYFSTPSIDRGDVVFYAREGSSNNYTDAYLFHSGKLEKLFDPTLPVPGVDGFESFNGFPSIDSGNIAFLATAFAGGVRQEGIWRMESDGTPSLVVDTNTAVPGGTGSFSSLSSPMLQGNSVVFYGKDELGQGGIYFKEGDSLIRLVGTGEDAPGTSEQFHDFGLYPSISNDTVAFLGFRGTSTNSHAGIYEIEIGTHTVELVADQSTPATMNAVFGFSPMISNSEMVFFAERGPNGDAVFLARTPAPGAVMEVIQISGVTNSQDSVSINQGLIAYASNDGIFANFSNLSGVAPFPKLISPGDQIDSTGAFISPERMQLSHEAVDRESSSVAFNAWVEYPNLQPHGLPLRNEILVAQISEPPTIALTVIALVGLGFSRRRL
jgi:hypothetical protein